MADNGARGRPRIVVLARHRVLGESLCHVLDRAGYRARFVGTPPTAARIARGSPDVVVVDVEPGRDRHGRLRLITELVESEVPVVGLAGHVDDRFTRRILRRAGATAVVGTTDPLARFMAVVDAVRDGTAGDLSSPTEDLDDLTDREVVRHEDADRLQRLSDREREILDHLRHGSTVGEIAALDVVAESTVRAQVASILRKLEVSSQLAAVAVAHLAFDPVATDVRREAGPDG